MYNSLKIFPKCPRKVKTKNHFKLDLKLPIDNTCLFLVEELVHTLAPLYEKLYCPTVDFLLGTLKPVLYCGCYDRINENLL